MLLKIIMLLQNLIALLIIMLPLMLMIILFIIGPCIILFIYPTNYEWKSKDRIKQGLEKSKSRKDRRK